ncbi:outer membrane beta-barrel family protein [soil metagenome]
MGAFRVLLVGGLLSSPGLAIAQSSAPAPAPSGKAAPGDAAGAVSGVTVVGGRQAVQTSIDRLSYDVSHDLQATSGSVADALRKVPSVDVSPQGDVSMRGAGVTIMIDGKISGAFRGPNAGLALQSLPAGQIERVEVITNPSAEFTPEGAGGVINLITKKTSQAGFSGSVRAGVAAGHDNGGVNLNYKAGKLSLNAGVSVRHDRRRIESASEEQFFSGAGATQLSTRDQGVYANHNRSIAVNLNGDYDFDATMRLSAGYYHGASNSDGRGTINHAVSGPDATLVTQSARVVGQDYGFDYDDVDFTLSRRLPGDERHQLTLSLDYDVNSSPNRRSVNEFLTSSGALLSFVDTPTRSREALTQLDLKYDRPMSHQSMLKLGYSLRQTDTRTHSDGLTGLSPALAVPDPGQTDAFTFGETLHAVYATYERPIGQLTVLTGLRLEDASHDLYDATSGQRATADEVSLYPSLHLAYALNDIQTLTFSYSHRISRPSAYDLNPFRQITDSTHLRQGDPLLRPQDTDSFEGGWRHRKDGTLILATVFRRDTTGGFADAVSALPGNVILTTRANIGEGHATGVELSGSGKLFNSLSYNLSANASYVELFTPGLGSGSSERMRGVTAGGKASATWQATAKDLFQADVSVAARQINPQGYTYPTKQLNLGYRHKLDEAWAFNVTATNAANSVQSRYVFDTPQLQRRSTADFNSRAVYLGFTYTFGQGPPRTPAFDFGGGGGSTP